VVYDGELPRIVTERLTIAIPEPPLAREMLAYQKRNAAHFTRWTPPRPQAFYSIEYWERRLESYVEEWRKGRAARFALHEKGAPDVIVGTCGLSEISLGAFRGCLLGYGIDEASQGKGLMLEAVTAVVRFAFDVLRLHRVMANYMPTNEHSGALLKRAGFTVEGYARDYLFIDGRFRDHVLAAITNTALDDPTRFET
jgi:ribosomal-protein-alanine N-acetyltransferase